MGASGVLGDPAAASPAAGEQFVGAACRGARGAARRPRNPRSPRRADHERLSRRCRLPSARASARAADGRVRPPAVERTWLRAAARGGRARPRARRHARRAVRRRRRGDHPPADRAADRSRRGRDGRRPCRHPREPEPHAPGASGRASRTAPCTGTSTRRSRRRSRRSPACCTTRSSPPAGSRRERLEPAGIVWGQADVDLAVNRRERTTDGYNGGSILGWNPDELVDNQVTVLQARRPGRVRDRHGRRVRMPPGHDRLRHGRLLGGLPGPDAGRGARRLGRRVHLLPGRGRERAAEVRLHGHRGRGAPDGDAARPRGARGGRRPVQPARSRSFPRRRAR